MHWLNNKRLVVTVSIVVAVMFWSTFIMLFVMLINYQSSAATSTVSIFPVDEMQKHVIGKDGKVDSLHETNPLHKQQYQSTQQQLQQQNAQSQQFPQHKISAHPHAHQLQQQEQLEQENNMKILQYENKYVDELLFVGTNTRVLQQYQKFISSQNREVGSSSENTDHSSTSSPLIALMNSGFRFFELSIHCERQVKDCVWGTYHTSNNNRHYNNNNNNVNNSHQLVNTFFDDLKLICPYAQSHPREIFIFTFCGVGMGNCPKVKSENSENFEDDDDEDEEHDEEDDSIANNDADDEGADKVELMKKLAREKRMNKNSTKTESEYSYNRKMPLPVQVYQLVTALLEPCTLPINMSITETVGEIIASNRNVIAFVNHAKKRTQSKKLQTVLRFDEIIRKKFVRYYDPSEISDGRSSDGSSRIRFSTLFDLKSGLSIFFTRPSTISHLTLVLRPRDERVEWKNWLNFRWRNLKLTRSALTFNCTMYSVSFLALILFSTLVIIKMVRQKWADKRKEELKYLQYLKQKKLDDHLSLRNVESLYDSGIKLTKNSFENIFSKRKYPVMMVVLLVMACTIMFFYGRQFATTLSDLNRKANPELATLEEEEEDYQTSNRQPNVKNSSLLELPSETFEIDNPTYRSRYCDSISGYISNWISRPNEMKLNIISAFAVTNGKHAWYLNGNNNLNSAKNNQNNYVNKNKNFNSNQVNYNDFLINNQDIISYDRVSNHSIKNLNERNDEDNNTKTINNDIININSKNINNTDEDAIRNDIHLSSHQLHPDINNEHINNNSNNNAVVSGNSNNNIKTNVIVDKSNVGYNKINNRKHNDDTMQKKIDTKGIHTVKNNNMKNNKSINYKNISNNINNNNVNNNSNKNINRKNKKIFINICTERLLQLAHLANHKDLTPRP
ncbi:hypothetical protein HELRODRAFT_170464 [Helobdella robusta]|uniref:Uncharacterized protein n=1 Tax=Helobdella robusta TaxID=6412 RepID=T1F336_HELRO|nr:hypothetical protein HELRODRAFT_170464 [Helobdella robusta]ESO07157.1 hypothetical protein HELRODRAFT_170464 [Helobdella robusta]